LYCFQLATLKPLDILAENELLLGNAYYCWLKA
jgi:hypothetical protein